MRFRNFGSSVAFVAALVLIMGFTCTSSDGRKTYTWPVTSTTPRSSTLSAVPSPSFRPTEYRSIAVIAEADHGGRGFAATADDVFTFHLLRAGYAVPARADVDLLLRELKLQSSGLTDRALGTIGQFLNVSGILVVRADRCSTERNRSDIGPRHVSACSVSARLLNVERAEVVWVSTASINRVGEPFDVTLGLLEKLAGSVPRKGGAMRAGTSTEAFSHGRSGVDVPVTAVFINDNARQLNESATERLQDGVFSGLLRNGYRVTSRGDVDRVVKEMKWQASGVSDREAAKIGRILNVPTVLLVNVNQADVADHRPSGSLLGGIVEYGSTSGKKVLLVDASAKLVDVSTSEVLWIRRWNGQFRIAARDRWREALTELGEHIGQGLPAR